MKPFIADNVGFGLPNCRYFKVELISRNGPSNYYKVGAESEREALLHAVAIGKDWIARNHGLDHWRVKEIGQFSAVLSTHA